MLQNYYEMLGLPQPSSGTQAVSQQGLRNAYRRALLQHHPDKTLSREGRNLPEPKYTVDDMTTAYEVLSTPSTRSEYDRTLKLQAPQTLNPKEKPLSGLDIVDLDDMDWDQVDNIWFRKCRCGNAKGYAFTMKDLEDAAQLGEVIVGCGGCSLWSKVVFVSVDDG